MAEEAAGLGPCERVPGSSKAKGDLRENDKAARSNESAPYEKSPDLKITDRTS